MELLSSALILCAFLKNAAVKRIYGLIVEVRPCGTTVHTKLRRKLNKSWSALVAVRARPRTQGGLGCCESATRAHRRGSPLGVVTDVWIEQDVWSVENVCGAYVKSSLENNLRLQSDRDTQSGCDPSRVASNKQGQMYLLTVRQDPTWRPAEANWSGRS